jgi:hypothetical protein
MGLARAEQQITWSAANTKTLSASTRADSDAMAIDSTCVAISVSVRCDNQGTPASGDVLNVYVKWSNGDLDAGGGADDFDSDEYAMFLMQLDTYATNTPGEDPCTRTLPIDPKMGKAFKLSVDSPNAATRNMLLAARMTVHTAS